ncbi:MAG: hypothetical protein GY757_53655 [bacterium]|nr:hypothetical protein [bacterium]
MTKQDAAAQAWINNQTRIIYSPREIRRGKDKGKIECYYRKGKLFKRTVISKSDIQEYLNR